VVAVSLHLAQTCQAELAHQSSFVAAKNFDVFRSIAGNAPRAGHRVIHFRFRASPHALSGGERVERLSIMSNRLDGAPFAQRAVPTGKLEDIDCGLVFRSIGYRGSPIAGLPFDEEKGVLPNARGRLIAAQGPLPGLYVTGWLKRGPSGIIGTNKADSIETVESLLSDLAAAAPARAPAGLPALQPLIATRCRRVVSLADWFDIDSAEVHRGRPKGKPREKFTRIEEMLNVLSQP
jgi:ferredoxin--NADP+ reductase